MRLAIFGIALFACLSVFAQGQAAGHNYQVFRIHDGYRVMVDDGRFVNVIATSIEDVSPLHVVRFKGDVEITINGVEVRADEVDYYWETGELEPLGNVHLKPVTSPNQ